MARPIRESPILYGEDARRFLENMKIRRSETPEARAQRLRDLDDFILNRASNFRKTQLLKSNHQPPTTATATALEHAPCLLRSGVLA
jgi:hypothetical protein